jgi:hypothetical protein
MDLRWGGADINRIRALAQELIGLQPDIILTGGDQVTAAIQRETRTIPIVFAGVTDPVALRIVVRLDRPGGNITGFADFEATLGGKWLELVSEIAPGMRGRIAGVPSEPHSSIVLVIKWPPSVFAADPGIAARARTALLITKGSHPLAASTARRRHSWRRRARQARGRC